MIDANKIVSFDAPNPQKCDICGDWKLSDTTSVIIEGRYCIHGRIGTLKVHRLD